MKQIRFVFSYLKHFLSAINSNGHGIHSPYMFHFTTFVLLNSNKFYVFETIEKLRLALKKNCTEINVIDYGTGKNGSRSVCSIAKHSLKSSRQAQLLFRIALHIKAKNILELGTSLGITTSYLASVSTKCNCITIEGSPEIAQIAQANFDRLGLKNITSIVGEIEGCLKSLLHSDLVYDLVFIDANHNYDAVISYFNQCIVNTNFDSVVVVDDIHWSTDMEKAWEIIKSDTRVTSSIDLFHMGIVFFKTDLSKKHYKIRY